MTNSGVAIKLPDGRCAIVYNEQPLLKGKGMIVLNLVDESLNLILNENKKPKTILKKIEDYNNDLDRSTLIGFVD